MDAKGNKIGLALSGGGYRAAAYHIGTLRALQKLKILDKVDVISSMVVIVFIKEIFISYSKNVEIGSKDKDSK